ncbi:diguanylate cyclase (GGDEF) domain-containing protein [Ruminococcaceae bacterium YRB3002]|nr:diguanylate cyclase (GGDEF) domain-containing protein [Ruminococcaceae bacterium YRB3002]
MASSDRQDRMIFKSGASFFAGLIAAFVLFIVMLAVCSVSLAPEIRFALCLAMGLLSFVINVIFEKYGFYVSFVLSFMELLIFAYEFLVLKKPGASDLAVITLIVMLMNIIHRVYLTSVLKRIYARRKAESAERTKAINKQLEEDIFARTKLIVSHDTETKSHRTPISDLVIDTLTTLPGRAMITDRLNRLIEEDLVRMQHAPVPDSVCGKLTVIYMSLDPEALAGLNVGHKTMDLFIQNMAHKLREAAKAEDMVARIYGTEFVVLAKRAIPADEFVQYKRRLSDAMTAAFRAGDEQMKVSFEFGVAVYPDDGVTAEDLITKAEEAMTGRVTYGTTEVRRSVFEGMPSTEIITMFESAMRSGEFHMVYQGCYDETHTLVGYEAFMRWQTKDGRDIPPPDFIRAAVKCGYIRRIGNYSLERALKTLDRINMSQPTFTMNINISNDQLRDTGFIMEFSNALSNSGASLDNVILDISEDTLFTEIAEIKTCIEKLSGMGVKMALDNFGRAYSSFNAIPLLPISQLKLDGNFTRDMLTDINVRTLTSAAVSLMHDIDIKVCATGVGDMEQLHLLKTYGCDFFQGTVLSAPMTEDEILGNT